MALDAFDYSFGRPDPVQLAGAGAKLVARYLFDWSPGEKGLSAQEAKALHAAGLDILVGYEGDRGNHLKGAAQGKIDRAAAVGYAKAIGVPKGTPIYYACDLQVFDNQLPAVLAYLEAADDPDYPSRCYSQRSVGDAWHAKSGRPFWQTIAWSDGVLSANACLFQYEINQTFHGSAVDYDSIRNKNALGAWLAPGHEIEEDMALSPDVKARFDQLDAESAAVKADVAALKAHIDDIFSTGLPGKAGGKPHRLATWLKAFGGKQVKAVPGEKSVPK